MMKTLLKILSTVAFALVLFMPAKNALSDDFPAGVSFQHVVGSVLEPHSADKLYTTLDALDFGFWSRYVRICLRTESEDAYFRFGTTVGTTPGIMFAATNNNLMVVPASASAVFIQGDLVANNFSSSFDWGALSMTAAATSGATGAAANSACVTQPWRTRGIVMHIASGLATADVWGYR